MMFSIGYGELHTTAFAAAIFHISAVLPCCLMDFNIDFTKIEGCDHIEIPCPFLRLNSASSFLVDDDFFTIDKLFLCNLRIS